jgi:hypothetical protein
MAKREHERLTRDAEELGPEDIMGMEPKDFLNYQAPPIEWAIPNLMIRGEFSWLYGVPGMGKSTLYRHALVANAMGKWFLGLFQFKGKQRFLVFDWENSQAQVQRALIRLGLSRTNMSNFQWYNRPRLAALDTERGRAHIADLIQSFKATGVIFDNRDYAFRNTDENTGSEVSEAIAAAKQLAEQFNIAVLVVSHEPKVEYANPTNRLRGHSAWGADADEMFQIGSRNRIRYLSHTKYRGVDQREELILDFTRSGERDTGPIELRGRLMNTREAEAANTLKGDTKRILRLLEEHGPMMWSDLERAAKKHHGIGPRRYNSAMDELRRSGLVYQPDGERTEWAKRPKEGKDKS